MTIDAKQLQQDTSKLLSRKVLAVGIFDTTVGIGSKALAPAAAGVVTYMGTKLIQKKNGSEGVGAKATAAVIGIASTLGTKRVLYHASAKSQGLTPILVCAVTANRIYLLDWNGSHRKDGKPSKKGKRQNNKEDYSDDDDNSHSSTGSSSSRSSSSSSSSRSVGPTKVLMEFTRAHSKIKNRKNGMNHHIIDLKEDSKHASIECHVGTTHSNKSMNKEVLKLLTEASQQQ